MQLQGLVLSQRTEEYNGKKGLVKAVMLTVIDQSADSVRLTQPLDYAMTPEESVAYGNLQDKKIVLGISELYVFGSRMRARGKIVANGKP